MSIIVMCHDGYGEWPVERPIDQLHQRDKWVLYHIINHNMFGGQGVFMENKKHRTAAGVRVYRSYLTQKENKYIKELSTTIYYDSPNNVWDITKDTTMITDFDPSTFLKYMKDNDDVVLYSKDYDSICSLRERVPHLLLYPNVQVRAQKTTKELINEPAFLTKRELTKHKNKKEAPKYTYNKKTKKYIVESVGAYDTEEEALDAYINAKYT